MSTVDGAPGTPGTQPEDERATADATDEVTQQPTADQSDATPEAAVAAVDDTGNDIPAAEGDDAADTAPDVVDAEEMADGVERADAALASSNAEVADAAPDAIQQDSDDAVDAEAPEQVEDAAVTAEYLEQGEGALAVADAAMHVGDTAAHAETSGQDSDLAARAVGADLAADADVAAEESVSEAQADDEADDLFAGLEPDARGMSRMLLDEQIALLIVDAGVLMPAAEFIRAVRAEAGYRVSPREISVAAEQLVAGRRSLSVTSVAELVAAGRGTRSERQQRHADDWRAFGALLLVRNLDGSPEGQREFIAQARKVAGARGTDQLLLRTALAVGNMRQALTTDLVGQVAQALSRIWQDLSPDGFVQAAQRTARRIDRENRRPMRGGSVQMDPNVRRTKRKKRSQR